MKRDVYKLLAEKYEQVNNPVSSKNPKTNESFREGEQALEAKKPAVGKHTGTESKVDGKELALGLKTELEHTNNKAIAKQIALDHLSEDPHYYSKLKKAGL
jgi:hypothetical protein